MYAPNPLESSDSAERIPARLREALLAAHADYHAGVESLRDAVCDFVEDGSRRGVPLDVTIDSVKRVVTRMRRLGAIPIADAGVPDSLVNQLVAWCMELGV